ncbi:MAG: STAS domain-containing protein [Granulosicoccus sp.]|nr:STAS domain-containing protein [Granulosicoccus sp.]
MPQHSSVDAEHFSVTPDSTGSRPGRAVLSGSLNFQTANQALESVAVLIGQQKHTVLDLSGVDQANSTGLALMSEWKGLAQRAGHTLEFDNVPSSLVQIAEVCQLGDLLLPTSGH